MIGPNLFTPALHDPMASLVYSQKVAKFFQLAIDYRLRARTQQRQDGEEKKD